ncbi:MAG: LacI family DNA-binding transcriptional regulator [Verrucomicrobia bacterium]|nr:LacI family DNA-binding transcriptional regulator [Verrucomicrobiota bacterium]
MPITLHDIARRARVSHVTVSNVLNRRGCEGEVSARRASIIRRIAVRMGYVPNHAARSLRLGRTHSIVLITSQAFRYPYVHEQIEKLQVELRRHYYRLHLELATTIQEGDQVLRSLTCGVCDGVIVFGVEPPWVRRLHLLRQQGMPVAAIEPPSDLPFDCIDYDRVEAIRLATDHLLQQGFSRVGIVVGKLFDGKEGLRPKLHLDGWRLALRQANGRLDGSLIFRWESGANASDLWRQIRTTRPPPTGLVCYNEQLAARLTHVICADGRRVPEDIALVALGNSWLGDLAAAPLTCVDFNHAAIARGVMNRLMKQMNHPQTPACRILVKPTLTVRESSGASESQDTWRIKATTPQRKESS